MFERIELNGKEYDIRLGCKAAQDLKENHNINVYSIGEIDIDVYQKVIYASLKNDDNITFDDFAKYLDKNYSLGEINLFVGKLVGNCLVIDKKKKTIKAMIPSEKNKKKI